MNPESFEGKPVTMQGKRVGTVIESKYTPEQQEEFDAKLAATQAALGSLAEVAAGPKQNIASRGPRNLPKPDACKALRQRVKAARRTNR